MEIKSILNAKFQVTLGSLLLTLLFILLEYFNGGVITHHLLAREDLPGISNWWGLLTIPLLTWIVMSFINKRRNKKLKLESTHLKRFDIKILKSFLAALLFGVMVSVLWKFSLEGILQYFILFPVLAAVLKPTYLPEYLLGFVIGLLCTFGGILPIIIGLVLVVMCFLVHKLVQTLKKLFLGKIG